MPDAPQSEMKLPSLEDMQHWTEVMGRAQQMMLEHSGAMAEQRAPDIEKLSDPARLAEWGKGWALPSPQAWMEMQQGFWRDGLALWQDFVTGKAMEPGRYASQPQDSRFAAQAWHDNAFFAMVRQSYEMMSDHLMRYADHVDGIDPKQKAQLRFATRNMIDAVSPTNFALTNPEALQKMVETRGESMLKGLENMLADLSKGQLTHTDPDAFELGRNIASTPGKVIKETPLYQLIQYEPVTEQVLKTPLVIFPPWINRFYILDLNPKKSFVKWALEQGVSVFMVSWKSADASMADVLWDDYVAAQVDAIDTIRDLLKVPDVHAIGYCVAGTTLAATLAMLARRGEAERVASATYFTAQVDFELAGDLQLFIDDAQLKMVEQLGSEGYLDGRYMAATFNALRGRDLIWNYVVNNYLLGEDYPPFDLLHWNGDTTNLPAKWHRAYLRDLYRDNKLVQPNAMKIDGTPIDLRLVETPTYIQAGRSDHIAPAESVWRMTHHFSGPVRFLLAGSGHIAGVVNPPDAKKYQHWINEDGAESLEEFIAGAKEVPGSWWPDWIEWLRRQRPDMVKASGARIPGKGKLKPIEDAPGRYVKTR